MARAFTCAGIGIFLTLCASLLAIFANIGQISGNIVPRNIRMVTVSTGGLGNAIGAGNGVYGQGSTNGQPNTGVRQYYEWGLWTYCSHDSLGGGPDYCAANKWATEWRPVAPIIYDAPAAQQTTIANRLPSGVFTSEDYLGRYSKAAFYLLFIGTCIGGLALIVGFLAHRFAFLIAALLSTLAFLAVAVGCIIYTIIIRRAQNSINDTGLGITVDYGVGLWLYWAAAGCLMFAVLPYLIGCVVGRDPY